MALFLLGLLPFIFGGSSAPSAGKITQTNNVKQMTQNDLNALNEQINSMISSTILSQTSSCSSGSLQDATVILRNIYVGGNWDLSQTLNQNNAMNFSCLNVNNVRNNIASQMINQIMTALQNNTSSSILSQMEAYAAAHSETGAGGGILNPFSHTSSESNVEQTQNYDTETFNYTNIQNIVEDAVTVSFTDTALSQCINSTQQEAYYEIKGATVTGNWNYVNTITQGTDLITNCVNQNNIANNVTSRILEYFGVQVVDNTETSGNFNASAEAIASSIVKGFSNPFAAFEQMLAEILGFFGMGAAAAALSPISSFLCCCCCCCLLIIGVIMIAVGMSTMGSKSGPSAPSPVSTGLTDTLDYQTASLPNTLDLQSASLTAPIYNYPPAPTYMYQ